MAVDEDGSGALSKEEFTVFQRRIGYRLSVHRINEIFANLKKDSKNKENKDINQEEF